MLELVSEYRALRASVLRLWHESGAEPHDNDVDDGRVALAARFMKLVEQGQNPVEGIQPLKITKV